MQGFPEDFASYFGTPRMWRLRYATAALGVLPLVTVFYPPLSFPLMPLFFLGLFGMTIIWLIVGVRDRIALPVDASRDARLARTTVIACAVIMLVGFAIVAVMLYVGWADMQAARPV